MKKALTISLAAIILIASMSNVVVYLNFKIHQSEIARTLCINKDKPKMHCEGKCILNERLAENNDEGNASSSPLSKLEETYRFPLFFYLAEALLSTSSHVAFEHTFHYNGLSSQSSHSPQLRPPEAYPAYS